MAYVFPRRLLDKQVAPPNGDLEGGKRQSNRQEASSSGGVSPALMWLTILEPCPPLVKGQGSDQTVESVQTVSGRPEAGVRRQVGRLGSSEHVEGHRGRCRLVSPQRGLSQRAGPPPPAASPRSAALGSGHRQPSLW